MSYYLHLSLGTDVLFDIFNAKIDRGSHYKLLDNVLFFFF